MRTAAICLASLLITPAGPASAYPLYGSEDTGIRRLEGARLAHEGVVKGRKKPSGELLSVEQVDLRLLGHKNLELPPPDPAFTRQIIGLLGAEALAHPEGRPYYYVEREDGAVLLAPER